VAGEFFNARDETISADLSRLRDARAFAEAAALDFGLDGEGAYLAKLAMSEVVANAVVHGSEGPQDRADLPPPRRMGRWPSASRTPAASCRGCRCAAHCPSRAADSISSGP
jgi:hypothetical protein